MPYFSIVIPVFNKAAFLKTTLDSVLAQSFTDFELILVNDGSTDGSASVIAGFNDDRIRYFERPNGGASVARNFGIAKAQSNYVTFLDADDYWYPDFLQEMFGAINRFGDEKIFAGAIEIEMPEKVFQAQYSIEKKSEIQVVDYFDASSKTTIICTSCAVFDKSIFEEIGNFDTMIRSGQDTDLWIRMGLVYPVVFSPKILARYVYDAKSLSKDKAYITQKLNFAKFAEAEKSNAKLKKFLDFNRFSFAIKCKLNGDGTNFTQYRNGIDSKNLTLRKKILLDLPAFAINALINFNAVLVRLGISQTVFK
jgi:glycosyltransferase involved in cell wall biosynthesis